MINYILTTYGIAYLLTESILLEKPRSWIANKHWILGELFYCPICISYWIGLILTHNVLQSFAIMGAIAIIKHINYK